MERLPILFVGRDAAFFDDPEHIIERRGCDLFPAMSVEDVRSALQGRIFVLAVLDACSARMSPGSVKGLHGALRRQYPVPVIVLSPHEDAGTLRAMDLPGLSVVTPPLQHGFLLELSERLVGMGQRRALNAVVQLFLNDNPKSVRMGFIENISRHGILVRVEGGLPPEAEEGVAAFVIKRGDEPNEVRVRVARQATERSGGHYGLAFTQVTAEVYERFAAYLSEG